MSGKTHPRIKVLPGAPWDESYILDLLVKEGYDVVLANGWEYNREEKKRTPRARAALNGTGEGAGSE